MNNNLTDITFILDKSGSMYGSRKDTIGGYNAFVETQKKAEGDCVYSMVQFDGFVKRLYTAVPQSEVPELEFNPGGSTSLLDAIGETVVETGKRLAAMEEKDRPGLVVMVIITDGEENTSREYNNETIRNLIKEQQDSYSWQFVFLGANQDSFSNAEKMGISKNSVADYSTKSTSATYQATAQSVMRGRSAVSKGLEANMAFTSDERTSMK